MRLISSEGYENAGVRFLRVREAGEIWSSVEDVNKGLGVKNVLDLILKEIYGKQIQKYNMTEREIFEKYANLNDDKLSEKSNKSVYVKNDVMTTFFFF